MYIDTHAHLQDEILKNRIDSVLNNAKEHFINQKPVLH